MNKIYVNTRMPSVGIVLSSRVAVANQPFNALQNSTHWRKANRGACGKERPIVF